MRSLEKVGWLSQQMQEKREEGQKLPIVCKSLGITHIVFTQKLHHMTTAEKSRALLETASLFPFTAKIPQGTQVKLARESLRGGITKYALKVGTKKLETLIQEIENQTESKSKKRADENRTEQQEFL